MIRSWKNLKKSLLTAKIGIGFPNFFWSFIKFKKQNLFFLQNIYIKLCYKHLLV